MSKYYLILLLGILCLGSCGQLKTNEHRTLTVSIEPLRYFTEMIAGEHFRVVSMVPEGNSPETYDPTPQQMVMLNKSSAFLGVGYIGFELVWTDKLKQNVPGLEFIDCSNGIQLIEGSCSHHPAIAHEHGIEPHVWNSIANARIITRNISKALCRIDSVNAGYYRQRTDSLLQRIGQVEKEVNALLTNSRGAFLIYHPALTYFARDYGWEQISIEADGKEPSPAHLQKIIRQCKEKKVKTVFIQKEFDSRNAEIIAREIGAEMVVINPLSYHWDEEMIQIAKVLGKLPNNE